MNAKNGFQQKLLLLRRDFLAMKNAKTKINKSK